jgi:outer membrane receptor protein involved in Fe transport
MNTQNRHRALAAFACLSASTATFAADDVLQEIVVTSTRQEQSLSKVPLSVVATDQETLDKLGVRSADDLARITPSITFGQGGEYYGTGQTQISIRGVASTSGVPTTGVYIDDTPIQSRTGVSPSLTNAYPKIFDLDRIEVLRGPQGTLFGTGSMGGAVRFITPEPVYRDSKLYARSELGTTKDGATSYEVGLAGGAPIVENVVGFRASFWHQQEGGYLDRLDRETKQLIQPDINKETSNVGRVAFGWKATDILTITPSVFFQDVHIADTSLVELATSDLERANYRNSFYLTPQPHDDRFWLPAIKLEARFANASLISNTSYLTRKTYTVSDDTSLNVAFWTGYPGATIPEQFAGNRANTQNHTRQKGWTQEIRLQSNDPNQRLNWVTGVFYSSSTITDAFDAHNPDLLDMINYGALIAGDPNAPYASLTDSPLGTELYQGLYVVSQRSHYHDVQKSVFAQADFAVMPRLKLTAGLRYTDATLNYQDFVAGPLYGTDIGLATALQPKSDSVTPKLGVSYQIDDNNLVYANAAEGVRGGTAADPIGSNCEYESAALGISTSEPRKIDSDSIWSYEVGSKNRLLDGHLAIDASIYHQEWNNIQTNILLPQCQVLTTLNLGNAHIDGFDLSLTAIPVNGLVLSAAVSRTDARYTSRLAVGDFVVHSEGEPLAVAPWMYTFGAEYTVLLNNYNWYAHADYAHSTRNNRSLDTASFLTDPDIPRTPEHSSLDLRAGVRFAGADVSVFANNLLDDHPLLSLGHDAPGSGFWRTTTLRPRTIGVTVSYKM